MKYVLIFSGFLFGATVFSQEPEKIYFDKNWEITDESNHYFYRTIDQKHEGFIVKDFWKNGTLQSSAVCHRTDSVLSHLKTNGDFPDSILKTVRYYKRNGRSDYEIIYSVKDYLNTLPKLIADSLKNHVEILETGDFYTDFRKKERIRWAAFMTDGRLNGLYVNYWGRAQTPFVISNYKDGLLHGTSEYYYSDKTRMSSAQYQEGQKHGKSMAYTYSGEVKWIKTYEHGVLVNKR